MSIDCDRSSRSCYYSASQKLIVIAIAGTNANSPYDLMTEDNAVISAVKWPEISPGGDPNLSDWRKEAYVSQGTATGLHNLITMTEGSGKTLLQGLSAFAANLKNGNTANLAVCGHSLGGALAPCLALYLLENWLSAQSNITSLKAYALAGPTPGDIGFVDYFEKLIGNKQIALESLYNTLDIVPRGWDDLESIPGIYDDNITPDKKRKKGLARSSVTPLASFRPARPLQMQLPEGTDWKRLCASRA